METIIRHAVASHSFCASTKCGPVSSNSKLLSPRCARGIRAARGTPSVAAGACCRSDESALSNSRASRRACAGTRAISEAAEAVTIDNCTVLVVGEGGVGMEVVRQLAKAGSWVTAFQAVDGFRKEIEGLGAMLTLGDAAASDKIEKALKSNSFDAVVYAVGVDSPASASSLDALISIIAAVRGAQIPRFLLVSSIGAQDDNTLESVEENLREGSADLKWTILRTGPLDTEASATKTASVSEDPNAAMGVVATADVAWLISQILFDADFDAKVLSAVLDQ